MQNIVKTLKEMYNVDPLEAPAEAVLWAADLIVNKKQAKKEMKQFNAYRAKHGKPVVHVPYGHHAF